MQNSLPFPSRLIKDQLKIRHNKMDIELTVVLENTAQMNSRNAEALQYFTFIRQPCTQSLPQPVQHRVPGPPLSPHLGQWRGSSFCRQAVLKGHSEGLGPLLSSRCPPLPIRSDIPPSGERSERRGGVFQKARPQRVPSPDLSVLVKPRSGQSKTVSLIILKAVYAHDFKRSVSKV